MTEEYRVTIKGAGYTMSNDVLRVNIGQARQQELWLDIVIVFNASVISRHYYCVLSNIIVGDSWVIHGIENRVNSIVFLFARTFVRGPVRVGSGRVWSTIRRVDSGPDLIVVVVKVIVYISMCI